ncbi:MAG: ATP-binding protein [Erysipelotrichaceae bacterium]|nr:ATP-binding protein [Erysipelotrichaceae bacterium]
MLIEFRFTNYRSFRKEASLSMEATGLSSFKSCLIPFSSSVKVLPACAIYGKNGGGKSNVIRAFWVAVQFIRNAQRTQHECAPIPVNPFALNDYSRNEPTSFDFVYTVNGIKYWYGFSATREKVVSEYLYHAPKGQKSLIFNRKKQEFTFTEEKIKRGMIGEMVAENQLFFSVACTMNDIPCVSAMRWFRNQIYFSRDYSDIPGQLLEYSEDKNMLKAISDYAKVADLGIQEMLFEFGDKEIDEEVSLPDDIPDDIREALVQFMHALSESSHNGEMRLKMGEVSAKARHLGTDRDGKESSYLLDLSDESDGTRKLMALAPAIESALGTGGVLLVDELERQLHPKLVRFIIAKFQSKSSNPNGAQLIFTTHDTELMNLEYLRKDQLYLVDKQDKDGTSELYNISEFGTRTTDNIRKGYLVGKYGAIPEIEVEEVE